MIRDRLGATLRLTAWVAVLILAGRLLLAAGSPTMSIPVTSLDEMSRWTADTPPADMAVAVLRLATLAAVAYLLAVTALALVARVLHARRLAVLTARASPAIVRRIVSGGSGIGLALGVVVGALPSSDLVPTPDRTTVAAAPSPSAEATMTRLDGGRNAPPGGEATMTRLDPAPPPADPTPGARPAGFGTDPSPATGDTTPSAPTVPTQPAQPAVDPSTWIVEPGDSFWSIAEEVMTPADGSRPDERDVVPYWRQLVEANRAQLVDPGNPDLLLPGQRLAVPPADG